MRDEIIDVGPGLKVRIQESRPEETREALAVQLVEAMDRATRAQEDVVAFTEFSSHSREKAVEMRDLIHRIKTEGRANVRSINPKTGQPRRMDPLQTYSMAALEAEMQQHRDRAQEFREKANAAKNIASSARREISVLQRKLAKAG